MKPKEYNIRLAEIQLCDDRTALVDIELALWHRFAELNKTTPDMGWQGLKWSVMKLQDAIQERKGQLGLQITIVDVPARPSRKLDFTFSSGEPKVVGNLPWTK
jgi:hypothetical protein